MLKKSFLMLGAVLSTAHAATTISMPQSWAGSIPIPDNAATGVTTTFTFTTGMAPVVDVNLLLEVEGGWNGDFYAYLYHDGKISIILNRAGKTISNPFGFGSTGFSLGFDDQAATDVHTSLAASGIATGIFQVDGRLVDPDNVLETDARSNLLSIFNGENADGDWTLFIADVSSGDAGILKSVTLEVVVVPEPSTTLLLLGILPLTLRRKRA